MKQINRREAMAALAGALVIPGVVLANSPTTAGAMNLRDEETARWVNELFESKGDHEQMRRAAIGYAEKAHQKGYPVLSLIFGLMADIWMVNKQQSSGFVGFAPQVRHILEEFAKNPR